MTAAEATTQAVGIQDNFFSPATKTITVGDSVKWTDFGSTHTTTTKPSDPLSGTPYAWNSGFLNSGGSFTAGPAASSAAARTALTAAGTYPYWCSIHTSMMTGTVRVKGKVSPTSGAVGTTFTITVASRTAPSGYAYVAQVKAPGSTAWTSLPAVTTATRTYVAKTAGSYQIRSFVMKTGTTKKGLPSPAITVQVG
jgi:plastocyanin